MKYLSQNFFMTKSFLGIWHSPTMMTWMGHVAKSLQLIVVMPLAFMHLSAEDVTIWLMLLTLVSLQVLGDMGFTPTFTRALSIAFSGAPDLRGQNTEHIAEEESAPRAEFVSDIVGTMRLIFLRVSIGATITLAAIGSAFLFGPIQKAGADEWAWAAWFVVLTSSMFAYYGNSYVSYLQAAQCIPQIHRLRTFTTLFAMIGMVLVLGLELGLFALVFVQQLFQIALIILYRRSAQKAGMMCSLPLVKANREIFSYVWSATWRSGLGVLFGFAVIQGSGLIYAQNAPAEKAAAYLLLLRLVQSVSSFSQAPFYSKLPELSRLWANRQAENLRRLAARGMQFAYIVYVLGVVGLGVFFPILLHEFGSDIAFPDQLLWVLFGIGGLIERFGAMHIQVYSLTNHIVWHKANGVTGILFIFVSMILVPYIDTYGFAIGYIVANIGFYSWYSALKSYRVLATNFVEFDLKIVIAPLAIVFSYLTIISLDLLLGGFLFQDCLPGVAIICR
jgi:O-antigen/teichoic acid export membrane protein